MQASRSITFGSQREAIHHWALEHSLDNAGGFETWAGPSRAAHVLCMITS